MTAALQKTPIKGRLCVPFLFLGYGGEILLYK